MVYPPLSQEANRHNATGVTMTNEHFCTKCKALHIGTAVRVVGTDGTNLIVRVCLKCGHVDFLQDTGD